MYVLVYVVIVDSLSFVTDSKLVLIYIVSIILAFNIYLTQEKFEETIISDLTQFNPV